MPHLVNSPVKDTQKGGLLSHLRNFLSRKVDLEAERGRNVLGILALEVAWEELAMSSSENVEVELLTGRAVVADTVVRGHWENRASRTVDGDATNLGGLLPDELGEVAVG